MRIFTILAVTASIMFFVFRWRYRIANTLLAIRFLRKAAVTISMNMPTIRNKVLPTILQRRAD